MMKCGSKLGLVTRWRPFVDSFTSSRLPLHASTIRFSRGRNFASSRESRNKVIIPPSTFRARSVLPCGNVVE